MRNKLALNVTFDRKITGKMSRIFGAIVLGVMMTMGAVSVLLALPAAETSAAGPDEAHVVVHFPGDNDVIVRPISFTSPVSAIKALELTGLDIITTDLGFGIFICSIEGIGCPASDCFCSDNWWSHWNWDGTTWKDDFPFPLVTTGDVEGWRWFNSFPFEPPPPPQPLTAAVSALAWLRGQQQSNGGYGSPGSTADVLLAVGSNRLDPSEWVTGGKTLLDYWSSNLITVADYADASAGRAGKLIAAVAGAGQDPQNFAGLNLVVSLTTRYDDATGAFEADRLGDNSAQAWGMLGWRAAFTDTTPVPMTASHRLVTGTNSNGGWGWSSELDSDTNSTAVALEALVAGGECLTSPNIAWGLHYLDSTQNTDGGFPSAPGDASDTNSTAFVIQALLAVGEDPTSAKWTIGSSDPISFLLSMQLPNGRFEWQKGLGTGLFSTRQAIPALMGLSFPLHVDRPNQSQCFVSPSPLAGAPGQTQIWLPIIFKQ